VNDDEASNFEASKLARRVDELEVTVSFQERTIAALDAAVLAFSKRVEGLERDVLQMRSKNDEQEVGPHADPPPHY
jgi:uncharacterized coiled-coil protein SlyX